MKNGEIETSLDWEMIGRATEERSEVAAEE